MHVVSCRSLGCAKASRPSWRVEPLTNRPPQTRGGLESSPRATLFVKFARRSHASADLESFKVACFEGLRNGTKPEQTQSVLVPRSIF